LDTTAPSYSSPPAITPINVPASQHLISPVVNVINVEFTFVTITFLSQSGHPLELEELLSILEELEELDVELLEELSTLLEELKLEELEELLNELLDEELMLLEELELTELTLELLELEELLSILELEELLETLEAELVLSSSSSNEFKVYILSVPTHIYCPILFIPIHLCLDIPSKSTKLSPYA